MSNNEKAGIFIFAFFGCIIGLSPFIPAIKYDLGFTDTYVAITRDGWARVCVGFFFVFGSKYFNSLAAGFGSVIKDTLRKYITKKE